MSIAPDIWPVTLRFSRPTLMPGSANSNDAPRRPAAEPRPRNFSTADRSAKGSAGDRSRAPHRLYAKRGTWLYLPRPSFRCARPAAIGVIGCAVREPSWFIGAAQGSLLRLCGNYGSVKPALPTQHIPHRTARRRHQTYLGRQELRPGAH